jgi:hypothetical protein
LHFAIANRGWVAFKREGSRMSVRKFCLLLREAKVGKNDRI